jgi:succinyl-CoA synthetase alpha subunit
MKKLKYFSCYDGIQRSSKDERTNERTNEMESSVKMMSPAARAAALKREKKAAAAAARIAGKVAAAERRAADEAAWTEGVRKGRETIEKKIAALRKAMGVRKNEPNPSAICAMKERMDFEMMCALRKDIYGESFVFL